MIHYCERWKTVGIFMIVQFFGVVLDDIGRTMVLTSSPFTSMPSMTLTDNFSIFSNIAVPLGLILSCCLRLNERSHVSKGTPCAPFPLLCPRDWLSSFLFSLPLQIRHWSFSKIGQNIQWCSHPRQGKNWKCLALRLYPPTPFINCSTTAKLSTPNFINLCISSLKRA